MLRSSGKAHLDVQAASGSGGGGDRGTVGGGDGVDDGQAQHVAAAVADSGLGVLAAWTAAAPQAGGFLLRRRDA